MRTQSLPATAVKAHFFRCPALRAPRPKGLRPDLEPSRPPLRTAVRHGPRARRAARPALRSSAPRQRACIQASLANRAADLGAFIPCKRSGCPLNFAAPQTRPSAPFATPSYPRLALRCDQQKQLPVWRRALSLRSGRRVPSPPAAPARVLNARPSGRSGARCSGELPAGRGRRVVIARPMLGSRAAAARAPPDSCVERQACMEAHAGGWRHGAARCALQGQSSRGAAPQHPGRRARRLSCAALERPAPRRRWGPS